MNFDCLGNWCYLWFCSNTVVRWQLAMCKYLYSFWTKSRGLSYAIRTCEIKIKQILP